MLKRSYLYDHQYGLLDSTEKMPNITIDKKLSTTIFPTLIDDIRVSKDAAKISKKIPIKYHRKMMSVDEAKVHKNIKGREYEEEGRYSVSKLRSMRF